MRLTVSRPSSIDPDAIVIMAKVHATPERRLDIGDVLFDLTVEIGSGVTRDCPAISTCRIILQEPAWFRGGFAGIGESIADGAPIASLSTGADDPPASPSREARTAAVAVLMHADWWLLEP